MLAGFEKWINKWRQNGWRSKDGAVKNREIIRYIDALLSERGTAGQKVGSSFGLVIVIELGGLMLTCILIPGDFHTRPRASRRPRKRSRRQAREPGMPPPQGRRARLARDGKGGARKNR